MVHSHVFVCLLCYFVMQVVYNVVDSFLALLSFVSVTYDTHHIGNFAQRYSVFAISVRCLHLPPSIRQVYYELPMLDSFPSGSLQVFFIPYFRVVYFVKQRLCAK